MRKSQKPWASVDANVHQPRSQGIFHEAEFARDIFQLISILRFLVVTTVLLHGKERQGKLADLSSLTESIEEALLLFFEDDQAKRSFHFNI